MNPHDFFASAYVTDPSERKAFGARWCGPDKFEYGKWTSVARYPKDGGDGQPAVVECVAMPARFYRVRVAADNNSVGDPKPGYVLSTGSGNDMMTLAIRIAEAAAGGMIGVYVEPA